MTDNVCLDVSESDTCNSDFEFFYIEEVDALYGIDGILGLSPDVSTNGPSYMGALISANKLESPVASFNL